MTQLYLATVIAAAVTTSLASHILLVRASSGSTTPRLRARLRPALRRLLGRAKCLLDDWIVAALARRERQAARFVLHSLSDRELKDMGLYRGNIGSIGCRSETRAAGPHRRSSICASCNR